MIDPQAACAHMQIVRQRKWEGGAVVAEWWECGGCYTKFVPEPIAAQARQQAIAECARIVFDEGYEAVAHRLRSLTPPPALTPTCIGYEGGCDGNLTGEPHEANCPKFAPPSQKEK